MKIRDRLTWTLSITALLAITALGVLVYISTAQFYEQEFFSRLEERVAISKLIFLENDQEIEATIRDRFLQTLDEEEEYAISLQASGIDSLKHLFPKGFATLIQKKETVQFWQGKRQGVGIHYHLPIGEYAVIVTAVDTFVQRKLNFLRRILLSGGLLAIVLLVVVDRVALSRALFPLEHKIRRASSITADKLDVRLQVKNPQDEIGSVAKAFNDMLDRLQNSFEAQRIFVRNASHEIQNPLTAIRGEAEVLLQKPRSPEEYQRSLAVILKESSRLQDLIRQLLELEKTDALSSVPYPEVFSIEECLLESIELFPSGQFKLVFQVDEKEHLIRGSRHLIQIAFQNIIGNALKYSENKLVTISYSQDDLQHQITVSDDGIGIPSEDLPNIDQAFFRSANARTQKGHGIGLAFVKKIISLHKGKILFKSKLGIGTSVIIYLPSYVKDDFRINS